MTVILVIGGLQAFVIVSVTGVFVYVLASSVNYCTRVDPVTCRECPPKLSIGCREPVLRATHDIGACGRVLVSGCFIAALSTGMPKCHIVSMGPAIPVGVFVTCG